MGEIQKNTLQTSQKTKKEFAYAKDGVSLNFTLRIDIKTELVAFSELLKVAQREVEEELGKVGSAVEK